MEGVMYSSRWAQHSARKLHHYQHEPYWSPAPIYTIPPWAIIFFVTYFSIYYYNCLTKTDKWVSTQRDPAASTWDGRGDNATDHYWSHLQHMNGKCVLIILTHGRHEACSDLNPGIGGRGGKEWQDREVWIEEWTVLQLQQLGYQVLCLTGRQRWARPFVTFSVTDWNPDDNNTGRAKWVQRALHHLLESSIG